MAMEILEAGPLTTVQDMGRRGYLGIGYQESGACDKYAYRLANLICGNEEELGRADAVLEFTLKGGTIRFTEDALIAITGADMNPMLEEEPCPMYAPVFVANGQTLKLGTAQSGMRTYLAVYGGVDVPVVMGSRSTNLTCHFGGYEGRALQAGDILSIREQAEKKHRKWWKARTDCYRQIMQSQLSEEQADIYRYLLQPSTMHRYYGENKCVLVRAVPGPQQDMFTEKGMFTLTHEIYRMQPDSNRMACRMNGEPVETKNGSDIISDGIVEGSVQIPASGKPIIMLADHQTIGGYAKAATIISTDIPALAQLRPGEALAFKLVTPKEAVEIRRYEEQKFIKLQQMFQ